MKPLFKQLIVEFWKRPLPTPTPRDIHLPQLPEGVRKAFVFIGMRRSGKTWFMFQRMRELLDSGVPRQNLLYLNFEDDRLEDVEGKHLQSLLDAFYELHPDERGDLHFFFDEIHEVPGWEKFIRRLLDTEQMTLYLSGSSAKMLAVEIASSLRGRTVTREIFPFSFPETLRHQGLPLPERPTYKQRAALNRACEEFLIHGGFCETIGAAPSLHRETLQSYIDTVIYRDIIDRYRVTNTEVLKRLLVHCLQNGASRLSINRLYHSLKSQGFSLSKDNLYRFMTYFEDAYCLFSVGLYHPSQRKVMANPKKVYPVDQGLLTAYGWHEEFGHGARLETALFSHLRRSGRECFYYETAEGHEVDFLTTDAHGQIELFQVSRSIEDPTTREREVRALREAMLELKLSSAQIITLEETEELEEGIHALSCAQFLSSPA